MLPTPPILLMIFNRPELTAASFNAIRKAKPAQLFVSADGPRDTHPDDAQLCMQARSIIQEVDWDCEVKTLFREKNIGLQHAMSGGITWFFENVEEGIIMEDDNVPDPSFFQFCARLLDRYRDDERVMSIAGENCFLNETDYETDDSYVFAILPVIWGWATWRRAWNHYDHTMSAWETKASRAEAMSVFSRSHDVSYWSRMFDLAYNGEIPTCGYRWVLSCLAQGGLHIVPTQNLTSNVGFGDQANNTFDTNSPDSEREVASIDFPLNHPSDVERNHEAELKMMDARYDTKQWHRKKVVGQRLHRRILRKVKHSVLAAKLSMGLAYTSACMEAMIAPLAAI